MTSGRDATIGIRILEPGDYILAADFLAVANQLVRLLTEVDIALSEYAGPTVDWAIHRLSNSRSAELVLEPVAKGDNVDNRFDILEVVVSGLVTLMDTDTRPSYYSDAALVSAKGLVIGSGDRVQVVVVFTSGTRVECTEMIATRVREILRPAREMTGSIDGYLQRIDSHAGFKFALWDPIKGTRIEGDIHENAQPGLREELVSGFGGRVRIEGTLRTNRKGEVRSVSAISLSRLRDSARFQSASDISGIYDISGGLEAEEYIRRLRDAG